MNLTTDEIDKVVCLGRQCAIMLEKVDEHNDIIICNSVISLFLNGVEICSRKLTKDTLKQALKDMGYEDNVFTSTDIKYSVLEIDKAKGYWKDEHKTKHVKFPKFAPIVLWCLLVTGKYPSVIDTYWIYRELYLEIVPETEQVNRKEYYKRNYQDRKHLNEALVFDGDTILNQELRFKKELLGKYVSGLPFNSFTAEQLLNRLYKVLPSLYRDPYTIVALNYLGADSYYGLHLDYQGVDGFVNGIRILGRVRSRSGSKFSDIKLNDRHPELNNYKRISITIGESNVKGILLPTDEALKELIETCIPTLQNSKHINSIEIDATPYE